MRAYAAMQRTFWTRRGRYRHDQLPRVPGSAAHLWPFARAMVATLDLAGIPPALHPGFDAGGAVAAVTSALDAYWDPRGPVAAYASDVAGSRLGGDRYHDDNAWVGLALVQLERLLPGAGRLERVAELVRFARSGWDRREDVPSPGGVFWVEQGRGLGTRNHDRNTVSTAPNAQLALHLAELTGQAPDADPSPEAMGAWVEAALGAGDLFCDKIRGDGSVDRALWSYNQGNMIGLNVLLHRAHGDPGRLRRAEAIARRALDLYAGAYDRQPAAFNAIFFRNLLQLHAATADEQLRRRIVSDLRGYADGAWAGRRDRRDRFRFGRHPTLLDQSAAVQVLALLAWDPAEYVRLA